MVGIGLTDLPNIGGASGPPAPPPTPVLASLNYIQLPINNIELIYFQKLNLELEENEGIIGDKPNFDQDRDWKAKGGISAGLFTLNSRPKAIR